MADQTSPILDADTLPSTATAGSPSAADTIRALARRHGVAYEPAPLDAFAADVSRLSDAEVPGDEIADLIVGLRQGWRQWV